MGAKFDKLDLMILNELRNDCKQSVRELAKKLGSHPNTIMQRTKALEKEKIIIKYSARIDFTKVGYDLYNLIFIKVNKATRAKWNMLHELKNFPSLVSCYAITGEYDVIAVARSKDRENLTQLIKSLNSREYVVETKTLMILEPYKFEYEYNPLNEWSLSSKK